MISIHYGANEKSEGLIFTKNGVYTEKEYSQLIRKRGLIKDTIKIIAFTIVFSVVVILRAYVFLKCGV